MSEDSSEDIQVEQKKIPKEFLEGVWIHPHINIDPENEKHGEFLNHSIRNDLWIESFNKISDVEMKLLRQESDYMKIKSIEECKAPDTIFQSLLTKEIYNPTDDEMLRCEDWTISINGNKDHIYRVKHFQSEADRFYSVVFPADALRYFFLLRSQYRIKFY